MQIVTHQQPLLQLTSTFYPIISAAIRLDIRLFDVSAYGTELILAKESALWEHGLIDAKLGGQVVKKRVALPGRGKRGSSRTLVAFKQGEKAFFIYIE